MDQHLVSVIIMALCLVLLVVVYIVGVEVGQSSKLLEHPGYSTETKLARTS